MLKYLHLSVAAAALVANAGAARAEMASEWTEAQQSRVRLVAGRAADAKPGEFLAGVEIAMPKGWKTYWRSPGETGIPPEFDWSLSTNAETEVLYPAPAQLADAGGVTLGYMDAVTFPVVARAVDPDKPVELRVTVRYGICKDICIPGEASAALSLPPHMEKGPPEGLAAAFDRVPRMASALRPRDPSLVESRLEPVGGDRRLVLRARFPGGGADAAAFLEGPGGAYMPPPTRISSEGEDVTFAADIGSVDVLTVAGKTAVVTLVGPEGQSSATIKLD